MWLQGGLAALQDFRRHALCAALPVAEARQLILEGAARLVIQDVAGLSNGGLDARQRINPGTALAIDLALAVFATLGAEAAALRAAGRAAHGVGGQRLFWR